MAITFNPIDKSANVTLSNGNLTASVGEVAWSSIRATAAKSSEKWYWEFTTGAFTDAVLGIAQSGMLLSNYVGLDSNGYGLWDNGQTYYNSLSIASPPYYTGDIISVALDLDNAKIWWAINGTWIDSEANPATGVNPRYSGIAEGDWYPAGSLSYTSAVTVNFGATAFSYTIPSGFSAYETSIISSEHIPRIRQKPTNFYNPFPLLGGV